MAKSHRSVVIAGVVERPRLYQMIDSPLVRICVIQGPSGSGKTILARCWALRNERSQTIIWVSLGESMNTRQEFWQRVIDSATRLRSPAVGSGTSGTWATERADFSTDPMPRVRSLLAGSGPVILVLDGYGQLGESRSVIDQDLARLILAEPELRLVITLRGRTALTDLDLPDGIVQVIAARDLAMSEAEIDELICGQTGITDERLVASVLDVTHGFAATVRSVALELSRIGNISNTDSVDWGSIIAARLESLICDPVVVQFVTDTSISPYFDEELATLLSGSRDPVKLFGILEEGGFGEWVSFENGRSVFQYAGFIRDAFRARVVSDEGRFARSCSMVAEWLLKNKELPEQALRLAIDSRNYELAGRVLVNLLLENPEKYLIDRLPISFQEIPESVLQDHPMVALGMAWALASDPILRSEAPRVARIAASSTVHPAYIKSSIDAFLVASIQAIAHRLAGDFRESAEAAMMVVRSDDLMEAAPLDRSSEQMGAILRQLSYSLFQGGQIDEAIAVATRSVALCRHQVARNYSVIYAAGFHAFSGNLARAKALLVTMEATAGQSALRHVGLNGLGLVAQAYACLDACDFVGALDVLRAAEPYLQTADCWCLLTAIAVSARQGVGQACAAAGWLNLELGSPMPPPGVGDNIATEHLYAVHALAWMSAGDYRAAGRILDEVSPTSPHAAGARVSLLLGAERYREALQQARSFLGLTGHTIRTRAETQTIGAVAALRVGDTDQAWTWLNAAAVSWETYGVRMHVAMLTPSHRRLLWDFGCERESVSLQGYLDLPVGALAQERRAAVTLTPRERAVLEALAEHSTTRAMATALVVSPHTVKAQLQSIYRKLGVSSRRSALAVARELGLLATPGRSG